MPSIAEVITSLIEKHGGKKTVIAKKLRDTGTKGLEKMSSQRLGQYASGKMEPKTDFYKAWKSAYNEDIHALTETNVSRETNSPSRDPWEAVHKLVDSFELTSKGHYEEVKDLRKDKEFLKELLLRFAGPDATAHKTQ